MTGPLILTEDVADTMRRAGLGPRWSPAYQALRHVADTATDPEQARQARAGLARITEEQRRGQADYSRRWAATLTRIAAARGWTITPLLSDDGTVTVRLDHPVTHDMADSVGTVLWAEAHNQTAPPTGWIRHH